MVSTLTPAALAKAPMVRFSKMACIPVDSVHKYGGKVTPSAPDTKGQVHVGTQKRAWRPLRRRAGCHSCRSEEHTSELQSLMRNSYAVFCLIKKTEHT